MDIYKLLDEIVEFRLTCSQCERLVGTWPDVPPYCPHCTLPAERTKRIERDKTNIKFIEELVNYMHTAIGTQGLPYKIELRFNELEK
jgi:predicted amidophosphoribosyltransferase